MIRFLNIIMAMLIILLLIISAIAIYKYAEYKTVQTICNHGEYDFCEVASYRIAEFDYE